MTNTNVVDIKENMNKLEILYDGQNITQNNNTLNLITFKVMNNGNKNVLKTEYDDNNPLGFLIEKGKIIEKPSLINASSEYLHNNVRISFNHSNRVIFSEVIFEEKEFFTIKVLVVADKDVTPKIKPIGKIAGVKNISVIEAEDKTETTFWSIITYGSILIHILRGILYLVAFILIIFIIFVPIAFISDKIATKKRKKIIKRIKDKALIDLKDEYDFVYSLYLKQGKRALYEMLGILKSEGKKDSTSDSIDRKLELLNKGASRYDVLELSVLKSSILESLTNSNIVKEENDKIIIIDKNFIKYLKKFIDYVEISS